MMYERGVIATGGLPFTKLKQRSLIDEQAHPADQDPEFPLRIREGSPVFETP